MADPEKVTIKAIDWNPVILAMLYHPGLSPFGPLASADDIFGGCHLYLFENADQSAYVAVRPVALSAGIRLDLVGVKSTGQKMCGVAFGEAIDHLATLHNAELIVMTTKLSKVAKKCIANGYEITGAVLSKKVVTCGQ